MTAKYLKPVLGAVVSGLMAAVPSSCVTRLMSSGYDERPLVIQTLSLFNQRSISSGKKLAWEGDWIFRRDRLDLIDRYFRGHRSDVVLFQQVLRKAFSEIEWDQSILSAGSFGEFAWRSETVAEYSDTAETELLAVAVAPSLSLKQRQAGESPSLWNVGSDGFIQAVSMVLDGQPVAVFNVQMPKKIERDPIWFKFIEERVKDWIKIQGICQQRVIVGGFIPADVEAKGYSELLENLSLKDSSAGFCDVVTKCQTATPENEIFRIAVEGGVAQQVDRILVPVGAIVYSAGKSVDEPGSGSEYIKSFGLNRLWPSIRSGWQTSVRLPQCP